MNSKQLVIGFGLLILGIAAVFATKKKASACWKIYWIEDGVCQYITLAFSSSHFTTGGTGIQATIRTFAGSFPSHKLYANCTLGIANNPVHFHP